MHHRDDQRRASRGRCADRLAGKARIGRDASLAGWRVRDRSGRYVHILARDRYMTGWVLDSCQ